MNRSLLGLLLLVASRAFSPFNASPLAHCTLNRHHAVSRPNSLFLAPAVSRSSLWSRTGSPEFDSYVPPKASSRGKVTKALKAGGKATFALAFALAASSTPVLAATQKAGES